jgi:hypothetical protein
LPKPRTRREQYRLFANVLLWTGLFLWLVLGLADIGGLWLAGLMAGLGLGILIGTSQAVSPTEQGGAPPPRAWSPRSAERPKSLAQSGNWPPPDFAIRDGTLRFTYVDAEGEVTERRVVRWKPDPYYSHCFTGFDLDRQDSRTFRIDRVESWG